AGGIRGKQYATAEVPEETHQCRGRIFVTRLDTHSGRQFGRQVCDSACFRQRLRRVAHQGHAGETLPDFVRLVKTFLRFQYRPLGIEAAQFVALADFLPRVIENRIEPGRRQDKRGLGQVVEQRGGRLEEQGQVVLDAAVRDALRNLAVDAGL